MKVRIGNGEYDAEVEPILVIFTEADLKNIAAMPPENREYLAYPEGMDGAAVRRWAGWGEPAGA